MAIIDTSKKEYYKIIENECYANKDGLYISVAIYNSKEDRDREKNREQDFLMFMDNVGAILNTPLEEGQELTEERISLSKVWTHFSYRVYHIPGGESIVEQLEPLSEDDINIATQHGFNIEWFNDPIKIRTTYITRAKDYEGDPFDISHLYNSLKEHETTPEGNGVSGFTDDL